MTSNQTISTCAEDVTIQGATCYPANNTCIKGYSLTYGHGVMTGKCVPVANTKTNEYSCEIIAWCPVEVSILPLKNEDALLRASENFTLLIKNYISFPKFKNSRRRNILGTSNKKYLRTCRYSDKNRGCPVFRLGDMVEWAGAKYKNVAWKGGVIGIIIKWNCNLDWDISFCLPSYYFKQLSKTKAVAAEGHHFRYAHYFSDTKRTLIKLYGIKFDILVRGQAGKFSVTQLLLNVGAGLGLLSTQVIICDIIILYLTKRGHFYKLKKYEVVIAAKESSLEQPSCSSEFPSYSQESLMGLYKEPSHEPLKEPSQQPLKEPLRKSSQQLLQEPSQQPLQEPSQQTLKELSQEPSQQLLRETSQRLLKELSQQPLKEPLRQSLKELSQEPLKESSQQLLKEISQKLLKELSQQPLKEPLQHPLKAPSQQPLKELSQEPSKESSQQPLKDPPS